MKNIILKSCLIALCLICGLGNAWGETVTFTTNAYNGKGGASGSGGIATATISGVTLSSTKAYYTEAHIREYSGGTITLSSENKITQIEITSTASGTSSYGPGKISLKSGCNGTYSYSGTVGTWKYNSGANEIVFNCDAQFRWTKMVVTYESSTPTARTVTFDAGTNGTCSTNSLTEASAGAGVTLPSCTPHTNYTFVGWSTSSTPSSADAGTAGANYKPSADCTLYAYYTYQAPTYTVTLGDNSSSLTETEGGAGVTLPKREDVGNYTFAGWSETNISTETTTAPTIIEVGTYHPTSNITLYPVYTRSEGGSTSGWVEVTTDPIEEGDYVILGESSNSGNTHYIMKASISSNRFENSTININSSVTPNTLAAEPNDNSIWHISKPDDYYRIQNGTKYAGGTNSKNQGALLTDSSADLAKWIISISDKTIINYGRQSKTDPNNKYLSNNGEYGWATYASTGGTAPRLFKHETGTTYYISDPTSADPIDATWSVDPASVTVTEGSIATATIDTNYDGTLSVVSNDESKATVTINDKVITVTGVAAGTTTLTVTGAATSNFNAISKTIDVTVTASSATTPAFAYFEETATINIGEVLEAKDYCGTIASDAGFDDYSISTAVCSAIGAADGQKISDDYACIYSKVSFKKAGTYVVHVTAPAVAGKYTASEGYITVTVNSSEENVVFDFNSTAGLSALGINVPTSGEAGANNLAEYYYNGAILMQNTNGSTPNREYYEGEDGIDLRVYNNSSLTFSGATITKIVITGKGMGSMSANDGNVNIAENGTATWTGSSSSVVLSPNASANMRTITVYYNPATVPSTYDVIYDGNSCGGNTVTGTPSDDNAYTANASVNVASSTALTRTGYTFTGWNTKSNGTGTPLTAEGTFNIAANTVIYAQWLINSYVVTMTAPENGSFTVSDGTNDIASGASVEYKKKLTLTATPETGYKFKRFVITPEGGEPIYKTNTSSDYTMGAANVTISAEFQALNTYTINWSVNGALLITEELTEGSDVTAPTEQEIKDALPDGVEKVFTGWVITPTVDADSEPEYVTPSNATANATYYAVFAKKTGSGSGTGGDYVLVESDLGTAWAGDYLIVYSDDVFADGRVGGTDGLGKAQSHVDPNDALSLDKKTVTSAWGDTYHVTLEEIAKNPNTYVLKTQDGKYSYQTSNKNGLAVTENKNTAAVYPITVTFNSNANISLALGGSAAGAVFHYNNNVGSTGEMFRFYKDGGQQPIYLYKKSATTGGTTYSDFTTLPYLQLNEANTSIVALENALSDKVEVARTMKADTWNTFCLPFSLTEEEIESQLGENAEVMELSSFSVTGEDADQILHMSFTAAETIEAGKLYMVCLPEGKSTITVEKKEINTTTAPNSHYDGEGYTLDFVGTYTYLEGSKNEYVPYDTFIISSNKFLYVNSNAKLKGFRGYIKAVETSTGNPVKALSFGVVDPLTGISNVEIEGLNNVRIYNLQGQMMNKLQKGINIVNGKKVIR